MPGGDGTGPLGTFRNCVPTNNQTSQGTGFFGRRFFRRGAGPGYGRGYRFRQFIQPEQEPNYGRTQSKDEEIKSLENQLNSIKQRLEKLKGE